jgi:hypothetical protein
VTLGSLHTARNTRQATIRKNTTHTRHTTCTDYNCRSSGSQSLVSMHNAWRTK